MSRVLVTGSSGFIGSHLVDRLKAEGHEVVGVDDYSAGSSENFSGNTYITDCRNTVEMMAIFAYEKPEIVFHLAANPAENKAQFSPIDVTSRGYDAFIKTITPAIKYGMKRFVFTSSIAVYGALKPPFYETDRPEPEDLYGITKYAAEETIKVLSKVHGFEYNILRPHNVYGPRQNMSDPYRNVVMIWMNKILRGERYQIFGEGGNARCYSYIDDVVDGIYKAGFSEVHNEIFNIGSDNGYTLKELSHVIQQVTETDIKPEYLPGRPQEVVTALANHHKARVQLETEAKVGLVEGITKTWEWAKSQGPQEFKYTDIELLSDKMPKNWRRDE